MIKVNFKLLISTLSTALLFVSCQSTNDDSETIPLFESLALTGVSYGPETRQFLDIYRPQSEKPTPVYFDAHGNGGNTGVPNSMVEDLHDLGITVIAWESLTSVNTTQEVETGWNDAALMFQWVTDHAAEYNLDATNFIVGGSSRGSILSWKYGHSPNPNIKGLYMYNALPGSVWAAPDWWNPTDEVNTSSPPVYFVYKREPGSSQDPVDPDIHDPVNGQTIVDTYEELGIGERATLVHSIGTSGNSDKYQFLVQFVLSVID